MSAAPLDESAAASDADAVHSVVLQRLDHVDPAAEPLRTRDLTFRELRDSLWLAARLRPPAKPPAGEPPPDGRTHPEVATSQPVRPEPPPGTEQPAEPDLTEPVEPVEPGPRRQPTLGEQWVPGPVTTAPGAPTERREGRGRAGQAWPTAPALSDVRRMARALRPLMRRHTSPWRLVVDEEATAERAAQDGLWLPQWQGASWRQFEVALVVDSSASMEIWQQTAREFRALLIHQGAFRDVRTYQMDTSAPDLRECPLRTEGSGRGVLRWNQLQDPTGRRIVLFVTDAVGRAWHSGAIGQALFHWGQAMPVAVVQTMDQRLWSWGGLPTRRMSLSAPFPGAANRHLRTTWTGVDPDLDGARSEPAVAVPVLGLTPEWLAGWARLLTAPGSEWVETTATLARPGPPRSPVAPAEPDEPMTAADRVRRFRTVASVHAFRLAGLLAAAPLSLPMIKLVQRVLLPRSTLSELAEVMLGGLLKKLPTSGAQADRTTVSYDFLDGVREELLACGQRADTARVARVLDAYAGDEISALRNYSAAVEAPDETAEPDLSPDTAPYLRVQAAVFRALSGPYHRRAKRLRRSLGLERDPKSKLAASSGRDPVEEQFPRRTTVSTTPQSPVDVTFDQSGPQDGSEGDNVGAVPGSTISSEFRTDNTVSAPQIWGEVPLRNPDFVGREDLLEQLRIRLLDPGAKAAVLPEALHGMGGVGKSQTVVEYIYRHAAEYDVVWWISAEHQAQIKSSFVELAKRLNLPAATADTAVPAVLEALRRGDPFGRWILVFDNADRPDDVRKFFPVGSGHVVVTSRNSDWGGFARPVEVDLFTRAESIELLHLRGGELDEADADRLAEALGDLPLAIEQAAAWRSQTGMQVSEYLQLLEANRTELLSAGSTSDYQLPVAAAWNVPLKKLDAEHKAALQLLQVCAFFGPEPISRKLFAGVRDAPVPRALGEALRDPIKLNRAIREISRYSLAKIDHRSGSLQLHRLVQTVLKNRLPVHEQEEMRHAVHFLLVNGDPGDPDGLDNWRRYAELLPHAMIARAVDCNDRWVRALIHNLVRYLLTAGDFAGARDLAKQAMESWRESIGAQELDTLEITRRYGIALRRLGQVDEAMELNRQTLESMRASFGDDHEILLGMLDTVAADRRSQGDFAAELDLQQQVYDRAKEILGEDDPATLNYAHNLGGCLRLMGDYRGALVLDQETLRRRTAVLGENHYQTFGSRNAISMDQREVGKYLEAARSQEKTLVRQREIFGNDHPRTLGAIRNLAVALRKGGRHRDAKRYAEECLTMNKARYGDDHVDTAEAQMTLSADLRALGELDRSLELATAAYHVFRQLRTGLHPYALIAATNLAVTQRLRGDLDRAKEFDELAYTQLRETFDADHPFTLVAATNLASDMAAMGDFSAARELDEDTIERSSRVLGADHPSTLAVSLNLALDLAGLGAEADSELLHSKTVAAFRRVLGPDHPATVAASKLVRANCDTDTMQL